MNWLVIDAVHRCIGCKGDPAQCCYDPAQGESSYSCFAVTNCSQVSLATSLRVVDWNTFSWSACVLNSTASCDFLLRSLMVAAPTSLNHSTSLEFTSTPVSSCPSLPLSARSSRTEPTQAAHGQSSQHNKLVPSLLSLGIDHSYQRTFCTHLALASPTLN